MPTKFANKDGFIKVTGGNVWYKIVGKEKGIPIIALHGGPGYPHNYLQPLEDLSKERQVIFYDQLGCGNSDKPNDKRLWTVERFVKELGQIIIALKLKEYHLLGQSWGTALAISFALTKPSGLKGIILASPFLSTRIWERDAKKRIQQLPANTQKVLLKYAAVDAMETTEFKKASDEYYKQFVYRIDPLPESIKKANEKMSKIIYNQMWGPSEFAPTGSLKNFDLTNRLAEINVPVLIISGRFDETTPESAEYFKSKFKNAIVVIMENSAHMSHWTDRDKFMKTARAFLKKID